MTNITKCGYFCTSPFPESASYAEVWAMIPPMRTAGWLQKRGRNLDFSSVVTKKPQFESLKHHLRLKWKNKGEYFSRLSAIVKRTLKQRAECALWVLKHVLLYRLL